MDGDEFERETSPHDAPDGGDIENDPEGTDVEGVPETGREDGDNLEESHDAAPDADEPSPDEQAPDEQALDDQVADGLTLDDDPSHDAQDPAAITQQTTTSFPPIESSIEGPDSSQPLVSQRLMPRAASTKPVEDSGFVPAPIREGVDDFQIEHLIPHITLAQTFSIVEKMNVAIDAPMLPVDGREDVWVSFEQFLFIMRPDLQRLKWLHLNELRSSFDEWDRRTVGELKVEEFEQLVRCYGLVLSDEERVSLGDVQVSFNNFVTWLEEKLAGQTLDLSLTAVRRFYNAFSRRYGHVTAEHISDLAEFLGFPLLEASVLDENRLSFAETVALLIPESEKRFNMQMMDELKAIFEAGDEDNNRILDRREFSKNVAPILGLPNKLVKSVKFVKNTMNFQEFVLWFCGMKPANQVSLNVLLKHFNAKAGSGLYVTKGDVLEMAHHFGNTPVPDRFDRYSQFTFQDVVEILAPNLPFFMNIAPMNELRKAFTESVETEDSNGVGALTMPQLEEWCRFYRMVGWMVADYKEESITFHRFVEWFCKELDMRHYKEKFDEYNGFQPTDMPKDTFKDVLKVFDIKLTPMERNEVFADNMISLDEFTSVLKSRDIEFMELPKDRNERNVFKTGKLNANVFKKRFDQLIEAPRHQWRVNQSIARDFCRFFNAEPPSGTDDSTFAELLEAIVPPTDSILKLCINEVKIAFDDFDEEGSGILDSDRVTALLRYLDAEPVDVEDLRFCDVVALLLECEAPVSKNRISWNILARRFSERGINSLGRITADMARDLFRFFEIPRTPRDLKDDCTFIEASSHILKVSVDNAMNDFLVSFLEFSKNHPLTLKWVFLGDASARKLCYYLSVRNLELGSRDAEVSFSALWRWFDECRRSPNFLNLNILKRRFDEFDARERGTLTLLAMHDFCRHFGTVFNEHSVLDAPYTFHEAVDAVIPPNSRILGNVRINDLKRSFDELRPHSGPSWNVPATALSPLKIHYSIHTPFDGSQVAFQTLLEWFTGNSSGNTLDNLNVLRRRFDEYDFEKRGHISLEDMNELSRFFHRPLLSAQQIDSLIDDSVYFHEAVVFLVDPTSPLLKLPIAFNEIKSQFEEYAPENDQIDLEALGHASDLYDIALPSRESYWFDEKLTFHDFYRWYTEKESLRPVVNPRIKSLNVLQKRFNERVDLEEPFLTYSKITDDAAIGLCRFFAEDLEATIVSAAKAEDGFVTFHELVRILLEGGKANPFYDLKFNDIKLIFEWCDRDNGGKLTLYQFEEAAHLLEIPLKSFTDAKIAQNGLTFSGFVGWILTHQPEIFPDIQLTFRRRYNNYLPNFNSLRKRFNEMDEMTGVVTIEKAKYLIRFFDLDLIGIAEARSLWQQEIEGIEEELREPYEFKTVDEAFEYLRPPPVKDDEGVEHVVEELTFQNFCHMIMYATDKYFEVDTLNELKDLFEALEESLGGEGGVITEAMFLECTQTYYLTEEEQAELTVVNGLVSFNEFVRNLAFAPKSFIGFAMKQSKKKGRECLTGCVVS